MSRIRLAVVAIVKDEAPAMFEWMAHHAALGVEQFYIYDNGSTDGTRAEIEAHPGPARWKIIDWPMLHGQFPAYSDALARFGRGCDWMAFLDADEFVIPLKGERLLDILGDYKAHAGLAAPWAVYGSAGHDRRPQGLVIENYQQRAPLDVETNGFLKCFVQPSRIALKVTTPHIFMSRDGSAIVLDDGTPVDPATGGFLRPPHIPSRLRINHYVVKSREDFEVKARRGLVTPSDARDHYFFDAHDRNDEHDETALSFAPAIRETMARRGGGRAQRLVRRVRRAISPRG